MLQATNLSYTYPGGETLRFPDLHCGRGETRLLLGKSGSGKTTLLQLLAGLRSPATGTVTLNGTELGQLSTAELDRFRGRHVGMIFQTAHFVRALSVRDNLLLAQRLAGNQPDPHRVQGLLAQLDIGHKADSRPAALSVGQQQRAAIARALVNQPTLLLADEPTSALDDDNAIRVLNLLRTQAAAVDAALLIVTHDNRLTSLVDQRTTL